MSRWRGRRALSAARLLPALALWTVVPAGPAAAQARLTTSWPAVEVELTTEDGRLNATGNTGRVTRVPLVVTNSGSAVLEDVSLSADPPSGSTVT